MTRAEESVRRGGYLFEREDQLRRIESLLDGARRGTGGALLVHGEAGTGKTALLDAALAFFSDVRLIRVDGVEPESQMPRAGLSRLSRLLAGSLLINEGQATEASQAADAFAAGLTVLDALYQAVEAQPVVVVVDDGHWLDGFTLDVLGVVARRLEGSFAALVVAARPSAKLEQSLARVERITVGDLDADHARILVGFSTSYPVDGGVAAAISDSCSGNPGRIVETVDRLSSEQLLGIAALPAHVLPSAAAPPVIDIRRPPLGRRVELRLLGAFSIFVAGSLVPLKEGVAATALRVIALRGDVPSEELEEILWPMAEPGAGRVRLRNVLHRIRQACGPIVERDGPRVRLAAGVDVDAWVFEERAQKALVAAAAGAPVAAAQAREAAALYRGELLPVYRSADWASAARERLARLHLSLLDVLEADAAGRGDTTEALRIIEQAIEQDPYEEERYVRAARMLAARGWHSMAVGMLRRARTALGRLGLTSSPAIDELFEELSS